MNQWKIEKLLQDLRFLQKKMEFEAKQGHDNHAWTPAMRNRNTDYNTFYLEIILHDIKSMLPEDVTDDLPF